MKPAASEAVEPERARVVCLGAVQPRSIEWVWPARIPAGKITLLIGDPGMAKTMLALDIAARVTRGGAFPDGPSAPSGAVVIMTAEDGLADTIRPRLDTARAKVDHVWALEAVASGEHGAGRSFCLASDVLLLEEVVNETHARLVIVDPLDGYLQGIDSHRNAEVRSVLAPLAAMLERTGAAGLLIHHLNKDSSTVNALYRAGGSLGFVAAARSVLGVAPDPDHEGRNLLLSVKLNIARKPEGIGYRVGDHGIEWDADPVMVDAATAFGSKRVADSDLMTTAKDFLERALCDGHPVPQLALEEEAGKHGVSLATLKRAKGAMGIQSKREGFGKGAIWYWQMDPEGLFPRKN